MESSSTSNGEAFNGTETYDNDIIETNKRIIEFVHDLKNAIENGHLRNSDQQTSAEIAPLQSSSVFSDSNAANNSVSNLFSTQISNLMNVNNLSNQTFSYIVNWLKTHQPKSNQNQHSSSSNKVKLFLIKAKSAIKS